MSFPSDKLNSEIKSRPEINFGGEIVSSGFYVKTVVLEDPIEGTGINSKEELLELEKYLKSND